MHLNIERTASPNEVLEYFKTHPITGYENCEIVVNSEPDPRLLAAALILVASGGRGHGDIYRATAVTGYSEHNGSRETESRPYVVLHTDSPETLAFLNDNEEPRTAGELRALQSEVHQYTEMLLHVLERCKQ